MGQRDRVTREHWGECPSVFDFGGGTSPPALS
jgi:hypothetical protein